MKCSTSHFLLRSLVSDNTHCFKREKISDGLSLMLLLATNKLTCSHKSIPLPEQILLRLWNRTCPASAYTGMICDQVVAQVAIKTEHSCPREWILLRDILLPDKVLWCVCTRTHTHTCPSSDKPCTFFFLIKQLNKHLFSGDWSPP